VVDNLNLNELSEFPKDVNDNVVAMSFTAAPVRGSLQDVLDARPWRKPARKYEGPAKGSSLAAAEAAADDILRFI